MNREQNLYALWLENVQGDEALRRELSSIAEDAEAIRDRFYRDLAFGTAGLRGVLGAGTNRMNAYTVGRATQGLADYLTARGGAPKAAIAYDSRNGSEEFAREAARVFAANGVEVWLYQELMPTPSLSYAVRELGCDTGVVITASHNPAKYNGYKAYGSDGCQIGPETASEVQKNINETDIFSGVRRMDFRQALAENKIRYIPEAFVDQYLDRVFRESIRPAAAKEAGLRLVYTPLNGAGNRCVRRTLDRLGVTDVTVVPQQEHPDGDFPTCPYPNPELPEALELGLKLCREKNADLLLATDPDADRVSVTVKDGEEYRTLTGNEAGVLLLDYIASARKEQGALPQHPIAVTSIVSSKLAELVAGEHGVEMNYVLTGFKFIGEVILELERKGEEDRFIFGFEESCGYLSGGYVRDKDAVNASLLLVEMASWYKLSGKTLLDRLGELYGAYGYFLNPVDSFAFEGADGMAKMDAMMEALRQSPPEHIGGTDVVTRTDYKTSRSYGIEGEAAIALPKSNVLEFALADGCAVIVRPSGTEPKIKVYYSLVGKTEEEARELARRYAAACGALLGVG